MLYLLPFELPLQQGGGWAALAVRSMGSVQAWLQTEVAFPRPNPAPLLQQSPEGLARCHLAGLWRTSFWLAKGTQEASPAGSSADLLSAQRSLSTCLTSTLCLGPLDSQSFSVVLKGRALKD